MSLKFEIVQLQKGDGILKSRKAKVIIFILVVSVISIYINHIYFFNPISFKQDKITYLSWNWYKKPLQVEYLVAGEKLKTYIFQDSSEVKIVISELKKSSPINQQQSTSDTEGNKAMITVDIRQLQDGNNAPGIILLHAQGYEGSSTIRTGRIMETFKITDDLKNLIEKRVKQAK
ncbi:MAG: hypothetical protein JWM44_1247 [Bacilli bacterium]|nr:hypothetical protein [Bacilli bacterium]